MDVIFLTATGVLIPRREAPDLEIAAPIVVGGNFYIGINLLILPGFTIGNNVIIGAGSVVSKSISDNCFAAGVPARVVKSLEEYKDSAKAKSLHLGYLVGEAKAVELKKYFNVER